MNLPNKYPASLDIDYPKKLDRLSTLFRLFYALPILVILTLATGIVLETTKSSDGGTDYTTSLGIAGTLSIATALMIAFRQRYPKWWFNFIVELTRFQMRVSAFLMLMTDKYPSTEDEQTVHLDIQYPDAKKLNRVLPFLKWFLALPHYLILIFLGLIALFAVIIAWFAILFTGKYPKGLFDFVLGVNRWSLRVTAYAFLLVTDKYPPFSLD